MAVVPFQRASAWSASLYLERAPRRRLQSGSRSFQRLVFAALSAQTAYFKPFCYTSLTCSQFPFHLPFSIFWRPVSHKSGNSTWHQGRAETLLSDFLIGMWGNSTELPFICLWRNCFLSLEETRDRNICVEREWERNSKESRTTCKHQSISLKS